MSRPVFPKAIENQKNFPVHTEDDKRGSENKTLSFQELHKQLQKRLEKQNILNDMRAELRNRLVHELYEIAEPEQVPKLTSGNGTESQLPLQISNWLVCNHFQRGNFEFTLSTFLRESGIVTLPEYNMTFHDVLYILGIHPHTEFYKAISETYSSGKMSGGLLFLIVRQLLLCVLPQSMKSYSEESAQTDNSMMNEEKVHVKVLHEIEYLRRKVDEELKVLLQEKVKQNAMKQDYICINCNKERQDGLSLLDSQKLEIERLEKMLKLSENDLKKQKERLQEELLLKTQEIENRITLQWQKKEGDLTRTLDQFQKDGKRTEEERQLYEEMKPRLDKSQVKVKELESQLELLTEKNNIQLKQTKSLQVMLESMADYEVVKSDLTVTKRELELALSRYQNAQNQWLTVKDLLEKKIAELTLKITSPCLELLNANTEVQRMIEKQEQDQESWNKERGHWQKELQREKLRVEEQKQHIENLNKVIQSLQHQIENLHISETRTNVLFTSSELGTSSSHSKPVGSNDRFSQTPSPHTRANYLQEAKKRIEMLQAEADVLERKYGEFMKSQRTLLSPTETFFSPLANPRMFFHSPSYFTSNMTFANTSNPKTGSFMLNDHYQMTAQLQPENTRNMNAQDLHSYLSSCPVDGTAKTTDTHLITGITPLSEITSGCYNIPFSKLDSCTGTLGLPVISNIPSKESLIEPHDRNAFAIKNHESIFSSDIKTSPILSNVQQNGNRSDYMLDDNNQHKALKKSSPVSKGQELVNTSETSDEFAKRRELNLPLNKTELEFAPNPNSKATFAPANVIEPEKLITQQINSITDNSSFVSDVPYTSPTKVLKTEEQKSQENKIDVPEVNLDAEWKKSSTLTPLLPSTDTYPKQVNLDDEWRKQSQVLGTFTSSSSSLLLRNYALKIPGNNGKEFQQNDDEMSRDNPNDLVRDKTLLTKISAEEDNKLYQSEKDAAIDYATATDDINDTRLSPDHVKANVEDGTESGFLENKLFLPKNHSTPATKDTTDASESGKSDSEINLSIGDQAAQSGNSNSESLW